MNSLQITLQDLQKSICRFGLALLILAGMMALHGNASLLHAQSSEFCTNGVDDDGDTLIDCEDPDCFFPLFDGGIYGNSRSWEVALGDLDGDGDLDAWVANEANQPNRVWINDGLGNYTDSGQALGNSISADVALGDLDGDGDLDAWVANAGPNRVWINDGNGNFTDSGQALGNSSSIDVALGDLDGDGDLDAWVANSSNQTNRMWINDGLGNFADSGQGVGSGGDWEVALGDLDGDGDLDVWNGNCVWINDGNGNFTDSGQALGCSSSFTNGVALGDLDGDGDLDAWVTNYNSDPNRVWLNDGLGNFTDSGQALGNSSSIDVTLGDLDGDGDLDAWVANGFAQSAGLPNRVYINDGNGNYTDSGQSLGNSNSYSVALGDLDDDGDLDAWVANRVNWLASSNQPNRVWINDGNGTYNYTGQALGNSSSWEVALGDLDGDGDLDAWVVNSGEDRVWINQGGNQGSTLGSYSDSGQTLENFDSRDVSLGDLDGDGDLDAFSANGQGPNRMWINQGGVQGGTQGIYSDSGQSLGNSPSLGVALGDLDGDGDLDAWVANDNQPNRVWINDGFGSFTDSGQALGNSRSFDVALGDLDGDGDLDAWVANGNNGSSRVWINQGNAQGGTPGIFATSGQALGNASIKVSLGDIDGDGDLDAWLANTGQPNRVWLNDGLGNFTDSGQILGGNSYSLDVALGDLDGDGDLDAWVANFDQPNRVWINQGGIQGGATGSYTDNGQELGNAVSQGVALGDLDGDGDLDAWVANHNNEPNRLWINQIACYTDDIDRDGIPNECDIDQSAGEDCNSNGILDSCDITGGAADSDGNGIPDECEETPFIRGDFNGDGGVDIGDAIATLDYLFTGGSINCDDAADSNDDGSIDVADGIQILGYLFSGTGDLPDPFPACGTDPTPDTLECDSYNGC